MRVTDFGLSVVGPFCTLIDPVFQRDDLRGSPPGAFAGTRHDDFFLVLAGNKRNQAALVALSRHDRYAPVTASEGLGLTVQPQAPFVLLRAMTRKTTLGQDRLD